MPGWSQSRWWCGLFLPWEAMKSCFPLHTRNQKAGKALLARRAKCRSQSALGPKNFPLEFLCSCAYSGLVLCFSLLFPGCGHATGTLPTATSTRHLPSLPWWDGVQGSAEGGHLRPTLHQRWENLCPPWGDLPIDNRCQQEKKQPCGTACGLQALETSRTWRVSPPGPSSRAEQLVALCTGSKDGRLVFKGWTWQINQGTGHDFLEATHTLKQSQHRALNKTCSVVIGEPSAFHGCHAAYF